MRTLNLTKTIEVVGNVEAPAGLRGNRPDEVLIGEARRLLQYKTNLTLLAWWEMFPCQKWWRYAIMATSAWAVTKAKNHRYFLKCLLDAGRGTKRFEECWAALKRFYGKLVESGLGRKSEPPKLAPHGDGCTCESCMAVAMENARRFVPAWGMARSPVPPEAAPLPA